MAEKLSRIIPFIFKGAFKKYKPISAKDVAKGMYITRCEKNRVSILIIQMKLQR